MLTELGDQFATNQSLYLQSCQRTERVNMSLDMSARVNSEALTKAVTYLSRQLVVVRSPASPKRHGA